MYLTALDGIYVGDSDEEYAEALPIHIGYRLLKNGYRVFGDQTILSREGSQ